MVLDALVEVPRADLPDERKVQRRLRWIRRALIASPVVALLAVMQSAQGATRVSSEMQASSAPLAVDVAMAAVADWVGEAGSVSGWVGFTSTAGVDGGVVEVHTVGVVMPPNQMRVSVAVAVSGDGVMQVVSGMSMEPASLTSGEVLGWPSDLESLPVSDGVRAAVSGWVDALLSGDAAKLRLATGDPDATHVYLPLVGWSVGDVSLGSGVRLAGDDDRGAVRVGFDAMRADGVERRMEFDVLLVKVSTASPQVVAWGPVGTGVSLVPFENASMSEVRAQPAASSTTSTSAIETTVPETTPATTAPATVPETTPATVPAPVETVPATVQGTTVAGAGS